MSECSEALTFMAALPVRLNTDRRPADTVHGQGRGEDGMRTAAAMLSPSAKEVNVMVITITKVERIEATAKHVDETGLA